MFSSLRHYPGWDVVQGVTVGGVPRVQPKAPMGRAGTARAAPLGTLTYEQLRIGLIDSNLKCGALFYEGKRNTMNRESIASEIFRENTESTLFSVFCCPI